VRVYNYQAPDPRSFSVFKPVNAGVTFPVYADLSSILAVPRTPEPNPVIRHVMAVCAGYSYATPDPPDADGRLDSDSPPRNASNTVADMMVRMGLEKNACQVVDERIDAMFIYSTAFIVQSADRKVVIIAYRGTETANFLNWLTDVQVIAQEPAKIRLNFHPVDVHAGFYRNVRATSYQVLRVLRCALAGKSILDCSLGSDETDETPAELNPGSDPALYITGHSLGGAMAAIMGLRLMGDPAYSDIGEKLRAVYTFGQPMIGLSAIAEAYEQIPAIKRAPVFRYIYRDDPVPHLPPQSTGQFMHFGREFRYHEKWAEAQESAEPMENIMPFVTALLTFPFQQLHAWRILMSLIPGVHDRYSIADHLPQNYIDSLTPDNQVSEFGDDYVRSTGLNPPGRLSNNHAGEFPELERFVANIARTATRAVTETPWFATKNGVALVRRGIDKIQPLIPASR
jgi:hypothetical protein